MKGQRPSNHIRVVNTKRGRKAVRVNPQINKKMTNQQYRKMMKKNAPFADADGDGVPNIKDCRPYDEDKQDEKQDVSESIWWEARDDLIKYKIPKEDGQDMLREIENINYKIDQSKSEEEIMNLREQQRDVIRNIKETGIILARERPFEDTSE